MRDFALGREFSLIFLARNSLLHLLSTEELLATFTAVRRHLAPDGIFAFDIFNPDVRTLARPSDRRFPVMEVSTAAFGLLSVEATHDYDPAAQVNRGIWYISAPAERDAWIVPMVLRSIFPQELPLLVSAGGLELVSRFGDLSAPRSELPAGHKYVCAGDRPESSTDARQPGVWPSPAPRRRPHSLPGCSVPRTGQPEPVRGCRPVPAGRVDAHSKSSATQGPRGQGDSDGTRNDTAHGSIVMSMALGSSGNVDSVPGQALSSIWILNPVQATSRCRPCRTVKM